MKKIGIYVHIPFCKRKCKYCDFVSFENSKYIKEYVDRLLWDIDNIQNILIKNDIGVLEKDVIIDTIYFGGGTPSIIDSNYIISILDKLKEKFNIDDDAEITIEVNPGTVNEEKLKKYYSSGINRLSIGCQETHDNILKNIGRIHSFNEFLYTYNLARKIGFKNINVDLMLALPGQTLTDLNESLNSIISLKPEHISVYSLILEEDTPLKREVENGSLKLSSDEIERKMYHKTREILIQNGFVHYEISNFAKKGFYSKHNLNCWNQKEYLGLGLASHSYLNKKRFCNGNNLHKYIEKKYDTNIEIQEIQSKTDEIKEFVMLGFRKIDGINKKDFYKKFNIEINKVFEKEILKLKSESLIEEDELNIRLTIKGLDFANLVFEEFV